MKALLEIKSIEQISLFNDKVDGFVLGYESFTSFSSAYFSFDDIKKAALLTNSILFINLNFMMHLNDTEAFKQEVQRLSKINENIHFIVQDLGASMIMKKLGLIERTIFNPYTYITNSEDSLAYSSIGFESVVASSEITLKDLMKICSINNKVSGVAFGYHPMYQSYRHIVDLYKEVNNITISNENLTLREFTREYKTHVIDNKYGSVVFRPYVISLLNEFDCLSNFKYIFINTMFLNDDEIDLVVNTYHRLFKKEIYSDEADLLLKESFNIEDGFKYADSVYNPKEF